MYLTLNAAGKQQRNQSRMVYMSMSKQYKIYFPRRCGYLFVLKRIKALLHTEINKKSFSAGFDISTASRYLVSRSDKGSFHKIVPFFYLAEYPKLISQQLNCSVFIITYLQYIFNVFLIFYQFFTKRRSYSKPYKKHCPFDVRIYKNRRALQSCGRLIIKLRNHFA